MSAQPFVPVPRIIILSETHFIDIKNIIDENEFVNIFFELIMNKPVRWFLQTTPAEPHSKIYNLVISVPLRLKRLHIRG
jgi:hypothetical protein